VALKSELNLISTQSREERKGSQSRMSGSEYHVTAKLWMLGRNEVESKLGFW
jgi:hypothetical protein